MDLDGASAIKISGGSALLAACLFNAPLVLLLPVMFLWGLTIVADSAQFSASITELSPPEYMGTTLTLQTSMGFLLTILSIQLVPYIAQSFGWPAVFVILALGPFFGTVSMLRLRKMPEALRIAGGRR